MGSRDLMVVVVKSDLDERFIKERGELLEGLWLVGWLVCRKG